MGTGGESLGEVKKKFENKVLWQPARVQTYLRDSNFLRRVKVVEPISLIDEIKMMISRRDYHLTFHARARMFERHISNRDLVDLIMDGDVIEEYPDREPCPAVLILGFVSGRQCHAVVACCMDHLRIITVYWPDEERWINHCLRRNE